MMGLMPLYEEEETSEFPFSTMGGYREKIAICKTGIEPSPRTESVTTLIFESLVSKTVRNISLLFKPPSPQYFVIIASCN